MTILLIRLLHSIGLWPTGDRDFVYRPARIDVRTAPVPSVRRAQDDE